MFARSSHTERRENLVLIIIGIVVAVLFAIAFWPARVARRKGHSFFLFFLLSLVFFPLALILAYVADDRSAALYR